MTATQLTSNSLDLTFRADLQGLRAIAIMSVVFAHAGFYGFKGGFVGVDLFFVLSGYLISGLLVREFELNGRISFIRFYARRLKRLLPALIVMLVIMTSASLWFLSKIEAKSQLSSASFAVTWTSNLYFAFSNFNYFDELASRDLFLHTWSLAVEEQFYLVWPMLLLLVLGIHRLNWINNGDHAKFLLIGMIFAFSLGISLYWMVSAPQAAFYLMPSRIWQFAMGTLVYLIFHRQSSEELHTQFRQKFGLLTLIIGLILVIASVTGFHSHFAYPGLWAFVPSIGASLIIASGYGFSKGYSNPLAQKWLTWIGDRSYSWYLWHWPILMLGFSLGFESLFWPKVSLVLLSLLVATISYRYVEQPFWKGRFSQTDPLRVLLLAILAMTSVVALLYQIFRSTLNEKSAADLSMQWRLDVPVIYKMPCDAWYHHARIESCEFGSDKASKTVIMLGDSIGAQWFSMIPEIFPEQEWLTVVLTKSSCPIVDQDIFYSRIGKIYDVCTEWRNAVLTLIEQKKPEMIILGNAVTYDFNENQWIAGSMRIFERLSQFAKSIIVIPGTPSLGFDGPGCISRHLSALGRLNNNVCSAHDRFTTVNIVTSYLLNAAKLFPNVRILSLNDLVCPNGVCQARNRYGIVVFRDSQHLTDSFVRSQVPNIRQRMKELGVFK